MGTQHRLLAVLLPLVLLASACEPEGRGDAEDVLDEVAVASHVQLLTGRVVELTAAVPSGATPGEAADAVGDAVAAALPCAEIARDGDTVTLDFGTPEDPCDLSGRLLRGVATVAVVSTSSERLEVHHEWAGLGDGEVTVDGSAVVTWAAGSAERQVVDQVVWSEADGQVASEGGGDRTQRALDGDEALALDGGLAWTNERGAWDLTAEALEVPWRTAVPRAGRHALVDPDEQAWTLLWEGLDADSARVEVRGPGSGFDFVISAAATDR